jgi:hypothetical protein
VGFQKDVDADKGFCEILPKNRAPAKHKLKSKIFLPSVDQVFEEKLSRKKKSEKLHRQKLEMKEKLCAKTKTKVFTCSSGERASECYEEKKKKRLL